MKEKLPASLYYTLCHAFFMFSPIAVGVLLFYTKPAAFQEFITEDGFLEWATFLLFSSSFLLLLMIVVLRLESQKKLISLYYFAPLGIAFVFLLGAMEEVSWFQRVLGHESSEFFAKNNSQGETNLHNLKVGGVKLNKLIFGKILFLFIFAHNIVLPILMKRSASIRKKVEDWGLFAPPLPLVAMYILAVLSIFLVDHDRKREFLEFAGAFHYFGSFVLTYFFSIGMNETLIVKEKAGTCFFFFLYFSLLQFLDLGSDDCGGRVNVFSFL